MLAQRVLESDTIVAFPNEADLSAQLGVSRTVLRESMKVLIDKGLIEMKPRVGTRSRPRSEWRHMDADILAWQAEVDPSPAFLRELCEVRLAIEPTAAGFAALRATADELDHIHATVGKRATTRGLSVERIVDLDLAFHSAIVAASHNRLLVELSEIIRSPIRTAMACTARFSSAVALGLEAHQTIVGCLLRRDPLGAKRAAEEAVGFAMIAVERVIRSQNERRSNSGRP